MDLASGKIELSERYIQKLKCGHTLQSYNAVVLWRNNGIGTPSVTTAIVLFNNFKSYKEVLERVYYKILPIVLIKWSNS